jgi:hypothetical protein
LIFPSGWFHHHASHDAAATAVCFIILILIPTPSAGVATATTTGMGDIRSGIDKAKEECGGTCCHLFPPLCQIFKE